MNDFLKIVTENKYLKILLSLVLVAILFFYLSAFYQGREIIFWPPSIGLKPDSSFIALPPNRVSAINGTWEGHATQTDKKTGEIKTFPVVANFKFNGKIITGKATFRVGDMKSILSLKGGFVKGDYMKVNYYSEDERIDQWGECIFKFLPRGKKIKAVYIGFGPDTKDLVTGEIDVVLKEDSKSLYVE